MEATKIQNIELKIRKLHDLLIKYDYKISTVESCTAGLFSYFLTYLPGCGKFFDRSLVTYSDEVKVDLLNIDKKIIDKFTAVSEEVCREMAINFQEISKSDITVSVTGYADTYNDIEDNGLVFIGVKILEKDPVITKNFYYNGRNNNRISAIEDGLELILKTLVSAREASFTNNCIVQ